MTGRRRPMSSSSPVHYRPVQARAEEVRSEAMGPARREQRAVAFLWVAVLGVVLLGGGVVQGLEEGTAVYIVTMKQAAASHKRLDLERLVSSSVAAADTPATSVLRKPRHGSPKPMNYGSYLVHLHNSLLKRTLRGQHYIKLYSYHYLINGFAVVLTPQQTKPHGHGDVHSLLYSSGLLEQWNQDEDEYLKKWFRIFLSIL